MTRKKVNKNQLVVEVNKYTIVCVQMRCEANFSIYE